MKRTLIILGLPCLVFGGGCENNNPKPYTPPPAYRAAADLKFSWDKFQNSYYSYDKQGYLFGFGTEIVFTITNTAGEPMPQGTTAEVLVANDLGTSDNPNQATGDDVFYGNTAGGPVFNSAQARMGLVNNRTAPVWGHPLIFQLKSDASGVFRVSVGSSRDKGKGPDGPLFPPYDSNKSWINPVLIIVRVRQNDNLYFYGGCKFASIPPTVYHDPRHALNVVGLNTNLAVVFQYWLEIYLEDQKKKEFKSVSVSESLSPSLKMAAEW